MMAFPGMIADDAKAGGIKVPEDHDGDYDPEEYPAWHILCCISLGVPINWGTAHDWVRHNAKIISKIPVDELKTLTAGGFVDKGVLLSCT
jgi:hypothetical protein